MNENPSLPERDSASSLQRHRGDSSLLQWGLQHLASLEELSSASELAVGNSESPLLWSFAAYSNDLEDVVAKRPSASLVISENLPDELKERRQWICWEWGCDTECPISPITGGGTCWTPEKWTSFAEALAFAESHNLAGIGFVLSEDDPYVVVDLYDCRDQAIGSISARAAKIIAELNTYSEIASDGSGVRLIARGNLRYLVEYLDYGYDEGPIVPHHFWPMLHDRYYFLPITGQLLEIAPSQIQFRQEELELLNDNPARVLEGWGASTSPVALINACRYEDQTVIVTTDVGIDVCLDASTGIRLQDAVIPPEPSSDTRAPITQPLVTPHGIQIHEHDDPWDGIYAVDPVTEEELWDFQGRGEWVTIAGITDGVVYVDDCEGIVALAEQSGEVLWHFSASDAEELIEEDALICAAKRIFDATGAEGIVTDDKRDGIELLELADGVAYVRASDGIRALDAKNGKAMWHLGIDIDRWRRQFILLESRIYIMDGRNRLYAADAITGALSWECVVPNGTGLITVQNGLVMFHSWSSLGAIDVETGEIRWEVEGDEPWSSLDYSFGGFGKADVVAGETIYAGDIDGKVVALESATGHERWRFNIGDPIRHLEATEDAVFVAGQHVLYAFRHV